VSRGGMSYLEMKNLDGVVVGGREVASGGRKKDPLPTSRNDSLVLDSPAEFKRVLINKHINRHLKIATNI
jgi:hypothetical protein